MTRAGAADFEVPPALLAGLVELVRATVRAEVKASQEQDADGDPWVVIATYLGMKPREASELARAGHVEGARKLGKRWRARRSACDAAIERIGVAPPATAAPAAASEEGDGFDPVLLAELGLEIVPSKGRARR